ncbi:MAG TPA: type VI secretion system contractile sheath small subunit, partial [Pantoea agglomerans]|nr:type VI secretion system contractile sheath small subunit [Pantoea agglomerans]HBP95805.1 type VI secretion system contractile sheath small subunit [Pantoea agglomerans]
EELIGKVLQDPTLLQALTHLPKQDEATEGKEPQA